MKSLLNARPRTTQPQAEVGINYANPLTNGLLVISNSATDPRLGLRKASPYGIVTVDPGAQGTGGQNVDSGSSKMPSSGGFSIGLVGTVMPRTSGGDTNGIKFRLNYNVNSLYHFVAIRWIDTGGFNYVPQIQGGISYSDFTNVSVPGPDFFTGLNLALSDTPVGSQYSLIMTVEDNSPTGLKLYLEGVLRSTALTKAVTYDTGANWMINDNVGDFPPLCQFAFGRTLSPAEVMSLHRNPWQLWRNDAA